MRIIDANALQDQYIAKMEEVVKSTTVTDINLVNLEALSLLCGYMLIMDAPTIEAEPTKHGRWIWNKRLGEWYCSNCDRIMTPYIVEKSEGEYEMAQPFYCGWCGAKMDEVEE